jgi:hypothetical protein
MIPAMILKNITGGTSELDGWGVGVGQLKLETGGGGIGDGFNLDSGIKENAENMTT